MVVSYRLFYLSSGKTLFKNFIYWLEKMAGKVQNVLNLEIVAGKAQPAPPLWPMLWANGVNIGQFT